MMDLLGKMNMQAHMGRPLTPENKKVTLWRPSEEFIHCCIESRGCRFNRDYGSCIMCDYGIGCNLAPSELEKALEEDLKPNINSVSTVLFGSYGSVLDTEEISKECFEILLDFIVKQKIHTVIFETHCCTVNDDILEKIQTRLCKQGIEVIIEMGYESCDTYVLEKCLNKILNLEQLCKSISLVHKYNIRVCLNVFLGAPFLSEKEQLDTAIESVEWAFEKGADSVVVFPCNIKPFTLLHCLYENGLYKPVSQWMLVELLSRIREEKLNCITLSWYGDRENFYENNEFPLIPPKDCEKCHNKIFDFYHDFMSEPFSDKRKWLVEELLQTKTDCDCYHYLLNSLKIQKARPDAEDIKHILEQTKKGIAYV